MSDAVTSSASTGIASASSAARTSSGKSPGIAENFQAFLTLLTTQLKNQSPLDPLNTNEFTQQLVSFAGIEQQMKTNDTLGGLVKTNRASAAAAALNLVGDSVVADASTARLAQGKATWPVVAEKAGAVTLTVRGSDGLAVATLTRTAKAGPQSLSWDGRDANGRTLPDGDYVAVVEGRDAAGKPMAARLEASGKVDGVDLSDGTPLLQVGGFVVGLDKVKSLTSAQ